MDLDAIYESLQFYLIIQLILFVIVAPLLMTLFALLTIRNRRLVGDRPMAVSKCRHMEHHLTEMLFLLVATHIVLNLPEWIEYLMLLQPNLFEPFIFTQTIVRIPIQFSYALPIVWYLIHVEMDNGPADHVHPEVYH